MTKYRVKAISGQPWKNVKTCLIGISVGQDYHEGEKFKSLMTWVSRRFTKAHIWVADTLHRHNAMFEHCESLEEATIRSRLEGDQWIVRNAELLADIAIPYTISRWDQWLHDPRYQESRAKIELLYQSSTELREAVQLDAERYVESVIKKGRTITDRDFAIRKCAELILEENSVFPLLIEDYDGVDVYPGSELLSTQVIRDLPVQGAPQKLYEKKFTRVGFKRLKGAEPQVENDDVGMPSINDISIN